MNRAPRGEFVRAAMHRLRHPTGRGREPCVTPRCRRLALPGGLWCRHCLKRLRNPV